MQEFIKIPANKASAAARRLVRGVGVNDAWYKTSVSIGGKKVRCQVYEKWKGMLGRCYSSKIQEKRPTYMGCSVCDEWLSFSSFARWVDENYVNGYELDKDIKIKGNKVYSPSTCLFVPHCINSLVIDCAASRGNYPVGVYFISQSGRYAAYMAVDCKRKHIGCFSTPELAYSAYVKEKNSEIKRKCRQYPAFAEYLINHLL